MGQVMTSVPVALLRLSRRMQDCTEVAGTVGGGGVPASRGLHRRDGCGPPGTSDPYVDKAKPSRMAVSISSRIRLLTLRLTPGARGVGGPVAPLLGG
jgi:hypothetical protein